ncbi:MAG: hypothetical protein AAF602_20160 [Myxococcota bacterium]
MRNPTRVFCCLPLPLVMACTAVGNPGDCGNPADGAFELTVTGSSVTELCGIAQSGPDRAENWGLILLSTSSISNVAMGGSAPGPVPGTYDIVDFVVNDASPPKGSFVVLAIFSEAMLGTTLTSQDGSLTIDATSPTQVSGAFAFSALDGQTDDVLEIEGSFTTEEVDSLLGL